MPVYVSASSRLHALLTDLLGVDNAQTLRFAWSQVLAIPQSEVQFGQFGLPLVARLVSSADDEAERAAAQVGLPLRRQFVDQWSRPVLAPGGNLDAQLHQHRVSPEALDYLESVESVLRTAERHEALPQGDELAELLDQVSDLADSIEASTELTDDVKQVLSRRIAQVRFAIENARVGGSEGVQEAVDLLVGAAVARSGFIPKSSIKKIFAVGAAAYMLFSAGPTVQASLEAWPRVAETLAPGAEATENIDDAEQGEKAER